MSIEIVPLDFLGQGALLEPADRKLHDSALEFCARELAGGGEINLTKLSKVWVGLKDKQVRGISGYVLKPDIPLMRATDAEVLQALGHRMNDFFSDNGARGKEVFLYIGHEKPEQRCPSWRAVLREFNAQRAKRFVIEVK